jgi:carbonic anhydrase
MPETSAPLPENLDAGYHRFRVSRYAVERGRYRDMGEHEQQPTTMILACSDSRVAPEAIFDARPGELFVLRNVAALAPAYAPDGGSHAASAALEYAVLALGVTSIVVMGHGRCGGINAAITERHHLTKTDFVGAWTAGLRDLVDELEPADRGDPQRVQRIVELMSVEQSVSNLRTYPWIRSRQRSGTLMLHGAWFDIALGELHVRGPQGWGRLDGH